METGETPSRYGTPLRTGVLLAETLAGSPRGRLSGPSRQGRLLRRGDD